MTRLTRRQFVLAGSSALLLPWGAEGAPGPAATPRLGMNLNGPADWNTELPFVDVFRFSRRWISQKEGAAWGKGPELSLDEHGWPKRLEPGCWAETILCTVDGGHYPGGQYTVRYEGKGKLEAAGAARGEPTAAGAMRLTVDPSRGSIFLRLRETEPADPVRNIRVFMPGFTATSEPWHPLFLARWRGVACLRFMDWMQTNGSRITRWDDRPRPEDATWTEKGVPVEAMVALANRLKADPWFCMPHRADDAYVRAFAAQVKTLLAPGLRAYVEYSNEVWNGGFEQNHYAGEKGMALGFADKAWEAAWRYTAYRSRQIFRIWKEVFGGTERLVRVLASQAANSYVSERIVEFQDAYKEADVLAIAPYVTCNVGKQGEPNEGQVAGWSADQALDYMEQHALPEAIKWIKSQQQVAERYGLKLVAYEGGQHMVGIGGVENNEAVTKVLHAANAHPRMGGIYRRYFDAWDQAGGGLFCYFASVGSWSKWGSWGVLRYYDDGPEGNPKYAAVVDWARRCGQPMALLTPPR